ncbi:hypothetical protein AAV99_07075 [Aurantiacibacter marinus]|uniref:Uncharacterized protein n=2 Tax=Aurantiacibacter marinus TaxID=874156 RepID=A0A0H0XNC4_9SPHN|nr:hypothetical protein AAV99_07075 [Aurantiacibacter marinus]
MLAAPLALVACAEPAAEEEAVIDEALVEAEAPAMTTGNGSPAGTYSVTMADGSIGTSMLNADGTSQSMDAEGNVVQESTWAIVDGKTCFTSIEEGSEPECWTESEPDETGTFTATSDDGEIVTVSPQA